MRAIAKGVEDVTLNASGPVGAGGRVQPRRRPGHDRSRPGVQTRAGWEQLPLDGRGRHLLHLPASCFDDARPGAAHGGRATATSTGTASHNIRIQNYEGYGNAFVLRPDLSSDVGDTHGLLTRDAVAAAPAPS